MKDLAMVVHFKTRDRGAVPGGPAGGYAWVYGRYPDFETFHGEVTKHFRRVFRYDVIEAEDKREILGRPDDAVEQGLVSDLAKFPIQYHTMQFYAGEH